MPVNGFQTSSAYTDLSSLKALKGQSKAGDSQAIKEVAQQFEAIFLQMMLSSMRKTVEINEEFSNEKSMYYDLFDKQVAMEMSSHGGIGMAKMIMSQLTGKAQQSEEKQAHGLQMPIRPAHVNKAVSQKTSIDLPSVKIQKATQSESVIAQKLNVKPVETVEVKKPLEAVSEAKEIKGFQFDSPMQFLRQLWHGTSDIIGKSGLDPRAIIAQAALETGWGKHIIKKADGQSSNNLFGIKSSNDWSGGKVTATTLEYKNGAMDKYRESFRTYESLTDSIKDYVEFITGNERYKTAVANQENPERYATELQRAGYATDPNYAEKIVNIMNGKEFKQFFDASGIKRESWERL